MLDAGFYVYLRGKEHVYLEIFNLAVCFDVLCRFKTLTVTGGAGEGWKCLGLARCN